MADLNALRALYGKPDAEMIEKFADEYAILTLEKCLEKIQYGFKRNGLIVFQLEYTAGGAGGSDDRPGGIPATLDLRDATWFSYLTYAPHYYELSTVERAALEGKLPIKRTGDDPPSLAAGVYFVDAKTKSYSTEDFRTRRRVAQ